jgi:DNA-binding GntR family transcriptional regulator/kynurenine formamidase
MVDNPRMTGSGLHRSSRSSLADLAYEALTEAIFSREIEPGARLRIDALAAELEMSITPVREALARTAAVGLTRLDVNRGYTVTPLLDATAFHQLFAARRTIESAAIKGAGQTPGAWLDGLAPAAVSPLRSLISEMARTGHGGSYSDYSSFSQLDHQLHVRLIQLAGNPFFLAAFESLNFHLHMSRLYAGPGVTDYDEAHAEHTAIVDALDRHDGMALWQSCERHMLGAEARLVSLLRCPVPASPNRGKDLSVSLAAALMRIGKEQRRAALRLAREGRVFDLGLELGEHVPQGNPGDFVPFSLTWRTTPEGCARAGHDHQFAAEAITGTLHVSTHIDGLAHIAADGRIFGGHDVAEVRSDHGFTECGMEQVPPILTRGLVLDVAGLHGVEALPDGYEVTVGDVQAVLDHAGVAIEPGDAVCVRTGKVREYYTDARAYQRSQPGVGADAAIWMYEEGMAVLGTDTTGTEPLPFRDEKRTTHKVMLVERGVHLVENLYLDEVADAGVSEGLFVCLPLRITGATGSWVRPILVS